MTVSKFEFTDAGFLAVRKGGINLESDVIVAVVVDHAHTASIGADSTYSDISANECSDSDYTTSFAEGHIVANIAWTDESGRVFMLDADSLDFGNSVTIKGRYVYLVKRTGSGNTVLSAGDLIVGYVDLRTEDDGNVESVDGNFDLAWAATGIYRDTVS